MDINAKVLAAFQVEHKEPLKGIRCDLRTIETLGHRLETLFFRVRQGTLPFDKSVIEVGNLVLESIENWMAALAENWTRRGV